MLDRPLDLLVVAVLRAWSARPDTEAASWYRAHSDPVVGPALPLLHTDLAHSWTIDALAARTGASRAALARRFTALIGQPPRSYLIHRRLEVAADLLRDTDATVEAVARRVGYRSGFALSAAFKRVRGISPRQHRVDVRWPGSAAPRS